ncbi:hypothetical protein ABZT49_23035 [Methylobacterium sp. EM32]
MSAAVAAFALGCGLAALLYSLVALALAPAPILITDTDPASAKAA